MKRPNLGSTELSPTRSGRRPAGSGPWKQRLVPWAYLGPGMILIVLIMAIPIVQGFIYSTMQYNLASPSPPRFIGVDNYLSLFSDEKFVQAFWQTVAFVAFALAFEFVLGFFFALLFRQDFKGKYLVLGAALLPWMMPQSVTAFMWAWILNGTSGVVNGILLELGLISRSIEWLSTPGLTLGVLIFIDIWTFTPFVMLVLYAGLQGIPQDLYEAATIDGASVVQRTWHVTIPMLKSAASVAFLMRSMMAIRTFDSVWIITRGGPAGTTELLGTYAYKKGMVGFNLGMGSAAASVVFVLSLLVSVWFLGKVLKRG